MAHEEGGYKILASGSYTYVLEVQYMGLTCVGKKLKDHLAKKTSANSRIVSRFEDECRLHSRLRHPNIVQFLGVHYQQEMQKPILVMEFLPSNLTFFIEKYGILPKEISYSILHDVALGLCYLHSQTPPIIHADLHSNNVLLSFSTTAKISDLGMAKILDPNEEGLSLSPGNTDFMPPETMMDNPECNTSIDEFSYGVVMVHVFSGKWPAPQMGPVMIDDGGIPYVVSEAERREVFLKSIRRDQPLKDLILNCISNDPKVRPRACEIVEQLKAMVLQFPASFGKRLKMLRCIEGKKMTKEVERKHVAHSITDSLAVTPIDNKARLSKLKSRTDAEKSQLDSTIRVIQENNTFISFIGFCVLCCLVYNILCILYY